MTAREKLQSAYEMAFYPPRLHEVWNKIKSGDVSRHDALADLVDMALSLHQALPDDGYASQRALKRLAGYQADARAFGTVRCLRHMRLRLGRSGHFPIKVVPGSMVRDIGLPPFCHEAERKHAAEGAGGGRK